MRQACAEKIILGGKTKKVRGGPSHKKSRRLHAFLRDLIWLATAQGCDQVIEVGDFRITVRQIPQTPKE
jgi:hypothetical protein